MSRFLVLACVGMIVMAIAPFQTRAAASDLPDLEPPIGAIVEVEGSAQVLRAEDDGKSMAARPNLAIRRGDILQTSANSKLLVLFIDESRFTLGENTKFKVDDYAYDDKDPSANMARYNILQGDFLYASGQKDKKNPADVKIVTPVCSIAVNGSTVWGGNDASDYAIYVEDGEVAVETKRGHMRMTAGQGTDIHSANAVPQHPQTWEAAKIADAKSIITLTNIAAIKQRMAEQEKQHPAMIEKHKAFINSDLARQVDTGGSVRSRTRGIQKIQAAREQTKERLNPPETDANVSPQQQNESAGGVVVPPVDPTAVKPQDTGAPPPGSVPAGAAAPSTPAKGTPDTAVKPKPDPL